MDKDDIKYIASTIAKEDETYRRALAAHLERFAARMKLTVDPNNLIVATHGRVTAALVPVLSESDRPRETLLSLVFMSLPQYACATTFPTGFYTVSFTDEMSDAAKGIVGTVIYRDERDTIVHRDNLRADDIPEQQVPSIGVKLVVSEAGPSEGPSALTDILLLWRVKPPGSHHTNFLNQENCLAP